MEFKENQTYSNFTLEEKKICADINSEVYIFRHNTLKNHLIAIKNSDNNKCFCVGFRTPPSDSTGVPHILEHSALSGSKKYPIKDVFSELVKGSLTTFLNAMTYSDKTIYPFSTRNEKEYFNLMDVYLDLTLNPLLEEDTFLQEGWHYHLTGKDEPLTYNGIVLNEMKGAYSDPIRKMWEKVCYYLMPDSTFSYSSGGYPENIVELTYQQFVDYHKKFYHPCNSAIVLYGNADLEKELKYIDEKYLSQFNFSKTSAEIDHGKKIHELKRVKETYPAVGDDSGVYLGYGVYTGEINNVEKNIAFEILTNILFNSEASPLKNALLKAKVGTEIGCMYNDTLDSFLFMYALGSSEDKQDKFLKVYHKVLGDLVKNGIDRELLLSELNSYEFSKREENASAKRGMEYTIETISSYFYNLDIHSTLDSNQLMENMRNRALNERYFESLIEKYLLDNPQSVLYLMTPDSKKGENDIAAENKELLKYKNSLSAEQINALVEKTNDLVRKQAEPNPEENLKLLPKLSIGDIKPDVEKLPLVQTELGVNQTKIPLWISENPTQGISYMYFGFHTDKISQEYLPYLNLFTMIFTEIGTSKRDYIQLTKDIAIYTGGFSGDFDNYSQKEKQGYNPIVWFQVKTFNRYIDETFDILNDVFNNTVLANTERLVEIIERTFSSVQYSLSSEGYHIALIRLSSYLNDKGKYNEMVQGYSAYECLKQTKTEARKDTKKIIHILNEIKRQLIQRENSIFHFTAEAQAAPKIKDQMENFLSRLPDEKLPVMKILIPDFQKNQAFSTPADVVFAGISGNIVKAGLPYSGKLEVLKKFLDRDYLYNKIRVQGGAYGNFSKLNRFTGEFSIISYRDPNVKKTYETYKSIPDALRNLKVSQYALDQIKISAYSGFDPLLSASHKGSRARNNQLRGITTEDTKKVISEILDTTVADLSEMADGMESWLNNSVRSIIGNEAKIKSDSDLFSEIITV
ncbi:MAG: insulinase family protein [Spirochaetia bacterium]|nr:insulinase family protein [Spirochaetia bacterium]